MRFVEYNGDKISKLSLGTVQFGLDYGIANTKGQPVQQDINKIINYVISQGVNCFDTAQAYGNSENVLGKALHSNKDIFVISKLKTALFKENLHESIEKSLSNLKLSSLYGLLLHDSELLPFWTETDSEKINILKQNHKIKYFGVSIYADKEFNLAIENSSVDIIQIPFNLFDQRAITKGWLKKAKEKNKLIFIRSIFLQGLFFMDNANLPKNLFDAKEALNSFEEYTKKLKISKAQLALSFVNSVAKEAVLLFGCDNIEQAKENINNFNTLTPLDKKIIQQLSLSFKDIDEKIYNPSRW